MDALDIITLQEAKDFLKIDFPDEDKVIEDCIKGAVAMVEDKTQYRLFVREEVITTSNMELQLFQTPLNSITSIQRISMEGDPPAPVYTDITRDTYMMQNWGVRTVIKFNPFYCSSGEQPVRKVVINVGYASPGFIPPSLLAAVRQLVTFLYENRNETKVEMPSNITSALEMNNRAPLL